MISNERNKKMNIITKQIKYCSESLKIIQDDINNDVEEQNKDPYDNWHQIRNHTRHANNVIYLRRQLLKLEKLLMEG